MDNNSSISDDDINTKKCLHEEAKRQAMQVSQIDRIALRNKANSRFKILIVEDDYINRRWMEILIRDKFGYQCLAVASGEAAIEAFTNEVIDLIFMDVGMYPLNGLETTERIRDYERIRGSGHVYILGQTGFGEYAANDAFAAGMDMVLVKTDMTQFDYIESLLVWFLHQKPQLAIK